MAEKYPTPSDGDENPDHQAKMDRLLDRMRFPITPLEKQESEARSIRRWIELGFDIDCLRRDPNAVTLHNGDPIEPKLSEWMKKISIGKMEYERDLIEESLRELETWPIDSTPGLTGAERLDAFFRNFKNSSPYSPPDQDQQSGF